MIRRGRSGAVTSISPMRHRVDVGIPCSDPADRDRYFALGSANCRFPYCPCSYWLRDVMVIALGHRVSVHLSVAMRSSEKRPAGLLSSRTLGGLVRSIVRVR